MLAEVSHYRVPACLLCGREFWGCQRKSQVNPKKGIVLQKTCFKKKLFIYLYMLSFCYRYLLMSALLLSAFKITSGFLKKNVYSNYLCWRFVGNSQPPFPDHSLCATMPTQRELRCWITHSSWKIWLTASVVCVQDFVSVKPIFHWTQAYINNWKVLVNM